MGLPALSKLYNNYRGKLPLNAGWTKGEKWSASLGTLGAFLLAAAWSVTVKPRINDLFGPFKIR